MTLTSHLLFFDTFSHDNSNIIQLDLVQFPRAVQVTEVRVIPLGARVKADFPGGVRLGATNPSQFEIEFFVNDLSKKGAAAFENIGRLRYNQHGSIHFEFNKKPPTDGLLLRGNYNTCTLAVYGNLTNVQHETPPKKAEANARPPPEKVSTHERIRDWLEDTKTAISPEYDDESVRKKPSKEIQSSPDGSWDYTDKGGKNAAGQEQGKGSIPDKDKETDKARSKDKKMSPSKEWISDDEDDKQPRKKRSMDEWYTIDSDEDNDNANFDVSKSSLQMGTSPISTKGGTEPRLPLPIHSEDMEEISDDEDIPDFPPNDVDDISYDNLAPNEPINVDKIGVGDEAMDDVDICEYEDIMSDEDDLPEYQYDDDFLVDEWENWLKPFLPQDVTHFPALQVIKSPTCTPYQVQVEACALSKKDGKFEEEKENLFNKVNSLVNQTTIPSIDIKVKEVDINQETAAEIGENFVQAMEEIIKSMPNALAWCINNNVMVETLTNWVCCGLDVNTAMNHPQPVYKIRHMKAGVRLCSVLLNCSSEISNSLLCKGVLDQLFTLLDQPHLALSIKLLILKALDAAISTPFGLRYMTSEETGNGDTGYERLLQTLLKLQQSRTKISMAVIIRKIHFLELCQKLQSDMMNLVKPINEQVTKDDDAQNIDEINNSDVNEAKTKNVDNLKTDTGNQPISPEILVQSFASGLKKILETFIFACQRLVQLERWLPGSKQFQLPKIRSSPYPFIYNVFEMTGVLEALSLALHLPPLNQDLFFLHHVKLFLNSIVNTEHGLRFLAANPKTSMVLVKTLMQFSNAGRSYPYEGESLSQLAMKICTMLYVVHKVDCVARVTGDSFRSKFTKNLLISSDLGTDCDEPDYEKASSYFNALDSLLNSPFGRQALVSVIGLSRFMEILFPYMRPELWQDEDGLVSSKSACFGYAVDIFAYVVKFQTDVSYLEFYGEALNELIVSWESVSPSLEEYPKVTEIIPWLSLVKKSGVFSYDQLSFLSEIVQESTEKLEKFPGELISALRILCHLAIPEISSESFQPEDQNNDFVEELKYKYATMQLFSFDVYTHLINLLSRLFSVYQQPFLHSSNFVGSEGGLIIMILQPTLALLDTILNSIIEARNTEFKDLTAVTPLIQTYILLQAFPTSSPFFRSAQKLKQSVVNVLLRFTQVVYTTEGEDVLTKSLWTQMISEVFKYILHVPYSMVCVMTLVTELLPLPLPLQSINPLTKEESTHLVLVRKLWSAHLYSLAPMLQEVIHRLGLSTSPQLTHSLRRMCVSLSDLSAPMALLIARVILDLVLQTHRLDQKAAAKEELKAGKEESKLPSQISQTFVSQQTILTLNMLASLVSHAPTKAAVLHLLNGGAPTLAPPPIKTEEKYSTLIGIWNSILTTPCLTPDQSSSDSAALESLLCIMYSLVDSENTTQPKEENTKDDVECTVSLEPQLNGVPHKELLIPIIEGAVHVIQAPNPTSNAMELCLKIILCLLEHNYGFYYVKSVLDKSKGCLLPALRHLCTNFHNENLDSFSMLIDVLDLFQQLLCPIEGKTLTVTSSDLSYYLDWKNGGLDSPSGKGEISSYEEIDGHSSCFLKKEEEDKVSKGTKVTDLLEVERVNPLKYLEQLVGIECLEDDEELEHMCEEISQLISTLGKEESPGPSTWDMEPPTLTADSLQSQFASRVLWSIPQPDDLHYSSWIAQPTQPDNSTSIDTATVNLLEISEKYGGEFDLNSALNKLINCPGSHCISTPKMSKMMPKFKPSAAAIRPDKRGKVYVAPLRGGRPFVRGHINRSDPFRSRPPNTSRPPSLHVDDFVALESTGHQPTGPTGYNKISFGRGKMMLDSMRGRGRGRGDLRGRFFHRHPFRGDASRGLNRGMGMRRGTGWIFRGDVSGRVAFRGAHMPPNRFMRGRPFVRAPLGMPGMIKNERFPVRFIERGRRDMQGGRHLRGFR